MKKKQCRSQQGQELWNVNKKEGKVLEAVTLELY